MREKSAVTERSELRERIRAARGDKKAELVVKNARFLDVFSGTFREGDVAIDDGWIVGIVDSYEGERELDAEGAYLVPGFIDSHVHIESSLMTPARFQQAVLPCGTTSVIWDPHEIANVRGTAGISWALEASEGLALDVFVMVPSCVPSTSPEAGLETSGASLTARDLDAFRDHPRVLGLAEMMNFPGLLGGDDEVLAKLEGFAGKKRDGHCPGLKGRDLNAYAAAGIHSCHESTTLAEAQEKMTKGIHVLVREGSCAKDAATLLPLLTPLTSAVVGLCSDDRNPADIAAEGHISYIIDQGLKSGIAPEVLFRAASYAPAKMFGLDDRGAIAPGYRADFVAVEPAEGQKTWSGGLSVLGTYKSGQPVAGEELADQARRQVALSSRRNLHLDEVSPADFAVRAQTQEPTQTVRVIGVVPRKILTESKTASLPVEAGNVCADPTQDCLKLAVCERHHGSGRRTVGFVQGFGIKSGAIATSINHDSHNVITVGSSDELMARAVNRLREIDGGIVVCSDEGREEALPLPIGGLMTDADPREVTDALFRLKTLASEVGCTLEEPFLQLSFLALPGITTLKITDRGLVDVERFALVPVLEESRA